MKIEKNVVLLQSQLPNGVMVASQILALIVRVRVLIGQPSLKSRILSPAFLFYLINNFLLLSFCPQKIIKVDKVSV